MSVGLDHLITKVLITEPCPKLGGKFTLWTPTKALLRVSKLEEYNIFFLIAAESGHQQSRNIFDLL